MCSAVRLRSLHFVPIVEESRGGLGLARGLDAMLQRIKDHASETLVRRYLALVSELVDEEDKARRMLAVAYVLQPYRPSEALRIAYLVYSMDREVLPALEIMIGVLEARGGSEKLMALRSERDRILGVNRPSAPHDDIPSPAIDRGEINLEPKPVQEPQARFELTQTGEGQPEHASPILAIKAPTPSSLRQTLLKGDHPQDVLARLPNVSRGGPNELGPGRERIIPPTASAEGLAAGGGATTIQMARASLIGCFQSPWL